MLRQKAKRRWVLAISFYIFFVFLSVYIREIYPVPTVVVHLLLVCAVIPILIADYHLAVVKRQGLANAVKAKNKELSMALAEIRDAYQVQTDFLANMSHELRTPLNAIMGFSAAMEHESFGAMGNPVYKEYASCIYTSGEHLLALINDILDLSKISSHRRPAHSEWASFDDILSDVMKMMAGYPQMPKRTFRLEPSGVKRQILVDVQLMRQVLLNVLSNAVKFTKEGGEIRVCWFLTDAGEFQADIHDNGIGIPAERLAFVLKPFMQVENVMTRAHQGTGLGLALVDKIMQLHGGQITLSSIVEKGTTVTLVLPSVRVEKENTTNQMRLSEDTL